MQKCRRPCRLSQSPCRAKLLLRCDRGALAQSRARALGLSQNVRKVYTVRVSVQLGRIFGRVQCTRSSKLPVITSLRCPTGVSVFRAPIPESISSSKPPRLPWETRSSRPGGPDLLHPARIAPPQAEQAHSALLSRLRALEQENAHLRRELQSRPAALPPPPARPHSDNGDGDALPAPARDGPHPENGGAPGPPLPHASPTWRTPKASPSMPTLFSLQPGARRQNGDWGSDDGDPSPRANAMPRAPRRANRSSLAAFCRFPSAPFLRHAAASAASTHGAYFAAPRAGGESMTRLPHPTAKLTRAANGRPHIEGAPPHPPPRHKASPHLPSSRFRSDPPQPVRGPHFPPDTRVPRAPGPPRVQPGHPAVRPPAPTVHPFLHPPSTLDPPRSLPPPPPPQPTHTAAPRRRSSSSSPATRTSAR